MKLETAQRYAREIAARVHSVNGLLATPLCSGEAARISRVWVFGSTVKGSTAPNDLDVLIEINEVGRRRSAAQGRMCKKYYRAFGVRVAASTTEEALKWLTKGMKKVSRHTTNGETAELDVKVLIYPRWDMDIQGPA
jgi:predicted nucleotidyltransferase